MDVAFYLSSSVAVIATILTITRYNLVHALLYLVVSFLALSIVFYVLGAPFMAALEIIIYAGAIVVLIIFVIMMLNLRPESIEEERGWLSMKIFIGPAILSAILLAELAYFIMNPPSVILLNQPTVEPKAVGISLYTTYVIGVELSGILLMSGIVGAYHLGRQRKKITHRFLEIQEE